MDDSSPALNQELLAMQIITIALVMGVLFFAGIVVFVTAGVKGQGLDPLPIRAVSIHTISNRWR